LRENSGRDGGIEEPYWGPSYRDFKWIDPERINLNDYDENSGKGIILEVDLEYP